MIYPEKIELNDYIGVTATSGGLDDEASLNKLNNAIMNMKELGFNIIETKNVRENNKLVSNDKKDRASEFMSLWKDEKVKYIILARGGEFLMEILPYLDEKVISNCKPKWVQGFSDSSLLLFYLTTNYGISTIHSQNFSAYGMEKLDSSLIYSIDFVKNVPNSIKQNSFELYESDAINRTPGNELKSFNLTEKVVYKNLYDNDEESFSGTLIGGCIDVLKCLIGTPFDKTKEFCSKFENGMIWYLENCELPVTELYRSLWQMKMAGWFDNSNAFLIGRTRSNSSYGDYSYEDVLHDVFDDMNVKVIYDVDFGHVQPQWTMINGSFANFKFENGKGSLETILK